MDAHRQQDLQQRMLASLSAQQLQQLRSMPRVCLLGCSERSYFHNAAQSIDALMIISLGNSIAGELALGFPQGQCYICT